MAKGETAYLDPDPLSPTLIGRIKSWIETSNNVYQYCRQPSQNENVLPYRVIDVGSPDGSKDAFLSVGHDRPGEYATLSYRWGTTATLTSTTNSVRDRQCKIPLESFPSIIRDGVILVRKLGIQYLWVDALCILQDSRSDWAEQSALMSQIYQKAMLNIAADSAQDTLEGFLKPRSLLNIRSCEHPSLIETDGPKKLICPSIPSAWRVLDHGALCRRGWILQEHALSKNILHCTSYELAWECTPFSATERQPDFCYQPLAGWKEIRYAIHGYDTPRGGHSHPEPPPKSNEKEPAERFYEWHSLVEEYMERTLTKGTDKLPAISGLAKVFQQSLVPQPEYIAGLWAQNLVTDMIWGRLEMTPEGRNRGKPPSQDTATG